MKHSLRLCRQRFCVRFFVASGVKKFHIGFLAFSYKFVCESTGSGYSHLEFFLNWECESLILSNKTITSVESEALEQITKTAGKHLDVLESCVN